MPFVLFHKLACIASGVISLSWSFSTAIAIEFSDLTFLASSQEKIIADTLVLVGLLIVLKTLSGSFLEGGITKSK